MAAAMGGAAACVLAGTAAWSQNTQNTLKLPGSLDRGILTSWLRANTDLDPANVISVSPANIIGLMAVKRIESAPGRQYSVQIRSEVISVETIREAGNSSWAADVNVDCQTRKGKVNRILDFPQRNLKGAAREAGGSAEWVTPPAGTHLHTVVSAICDSGFQRPLAPAQQAAAPPAARPQASAPAIIATAPRTPQPAAPAAPSVQQQAPVAPLRPAAPPAASPPAQRAAAAPAPTPTPPSRTVRSPVAVQIGAVSSEAQAAQVLRSALARFDQAQVLSASTARIESNGQVLYRALIHGFPTAADARAFCNTYKAAGRDCLMRSAVPPGARSVVSR